MHSDMIHTVHDVRMHLHDIEFSGINYTLLRRERNMVLSAIE